MRPAIGPVAFAALSALALGACGPSRAEWVLTDDPEGDVLQLEVAIGNSCNSLDRIDVVERPGIVNITAYVETHGSSCADILQIEHHEVRLGQPLGERMLLGCDPTNRYDYVRGPGLVDCRSVSNSGTEWRLRKPPTGSKLELVAQVGACSSIDRVAVNETDNEVNIAVYVRAGPRGGRDADEPSPNQKCIPGLGYTTVELNQPLGNRTLTGCDRPVDVRPRTVAVEECAELIDPDWSLGP